MQPTAQEYQKLLTEIIKKLIVVFGPAIVLSKAKSISDLEIADDGTITNIHSDPTQTTHKTIDALKELSGEAVERIIEPLSVNYPGLINTAGGKNPDTTDAKLNTIMPAPMAAPISNAIQTHDTPLPTISIAPMPAPVPLAVTEIESSSQNINVAGHSNG